MARNTPSRIKPLPTGTAVPKVMAGNARRMLNVQPDLPDLRDRVYEPTLRNLMVELPAPPATKEMILDQGQEGACTGFALAGVINELLRQRWEHYQTLSTIPPDLQVKPVSPRMLYEMAKLHDEWPGEDYEGSSIRGAIKGFFHNGVCELKLAPYRAKEKNWSLTVDQAKNARSTGLGAYYRLRPTIIDYHAALNEVGAIIVSATVHEGWMSPVDGIIEKSQNSVGGHAFAIVGYDAKGFLVRNSWGPGWGGFKGTSGTAHWSYYDWAENVSDAWVLRLAVPAPDAFDLTHIAVNKTSATGMRLAELPDPRRLDVLGHIIHLDDGKLVEQGTYATSRDNIKETAKYLTADAGDANRKFEHLLFYAHGGLNSAVASARRVVAMKEPFKRNGIYPMHFMWETGFTEELGDLFVELFRRSEERMGGIGEWRDMVIEQTARGVGRRLWREMKLDARRAFARNAGGLVAAKILLDANASLQRPRKVHFVGHSAGSILLGELIRSWGKIGGTGQTIESMGLMAPACTSEFYTQVYVPALGKGGGKPAVNRLRQYNLTDKLEQDDTVGPYGKSLLYLVSNAFEAAKAMPLLGMQTFAQELALPSNHTIHYADPDKPSSKSGSTSHGGFDNDLRTMNDILANILGKAPDPSKAFQPQDLIGY